MGDVWEGMTENEKGPMVDVAITLVRGWARAELDAGCVLAPWSEARERTMHALALYGIDQAVIEANEQRVASAWEGAKLAHEAGRDWVIRICREREEAMKQVASMESHREDLARSRRQVIGLQKHVDTLKQQVEAREAEITRLKKEARTG